MKNRVAVVTGANRGIGYEICLQLARQGHTVVLTARDKEKGMKAAAQLQEEKLSVKFHQLDVTSDQSIRDLTSFMEKEFGRCDILVNNAGVFPEPRGSGVLHPDMGMIRTTIETNLYGPVMMCQALVPLMKKNRYGRIVNFSSTLGQLSDMGGGFPGYRMSKTAINALTRMVHNEVQGENILINSLCPGWVKTAMGGPGATKSVEEGADTAVWLATLPDGGPSGKFFRDRKEIPW